MDVDDNSEFDQHEAVHHLYDHKSGLRSIVAVHSTVRGPAAGGCRLWQYDKEQDAITDALRLSRGMTFKNALAGLPFGGGKAVIMVRPGQQKSVRLFEAFGQFVDSLKGKYITAEDVGVTTEDMSIVSERTRFVAGLTQQHDAAGGDPSPWTARGVYLSIKAAVKLKLGTDCLRGLRIAVQGVGSVGYNLCGLLRRDGATLTIADINAQNIKRACATYSVSVAPPTDILGQDVDVLCPCALGGVLNAQTIPRIRAPIVVGAANNQLATDDDGRLANAAGILYAPDYLVNAGGIISVAREYLGDVDRQRVIDEIGRIPDRLLKILATAERTGKPPQSVADNMAREIVMAHMSSKTGLTNVG